MRLYKVHFTFAEEYRPKEPCFLSINLVVAAEDQFKALAAAWEKIKVLELPEPTAFNASRVTKDC